MTELRVMCWNVQNLFPAGEVDGPDTESEFDAKIASLAAVIDEFRPHVLALQEVGTPPALRSLQRALSWDMRYAESGEPDDRGIRVAFLASRVLRDVVHAREFPIRLLPVQVGDDPPGPSGPPLMNQMGRGSLGVTIRAGGRDIRIVTCHLKSKLLTFPGERFSPRDEDERARYAGYALMRRTAEAVTLRHHVTARLAGRGREEAHLLVGDLNDTTEAATTQILQGPPGSEIGTTGFDRADKGDGDRLWNLAPLIPPERAYTRIYRGRRELIDHVLASHLLVSGDEPPHVTTVCCADELPSMADDPDQRRNEEGSDHAAVTVRLRLPATAD
jgi:endonuclease/exonuclease/phosphatase family metal-dependent hydrolase